jgi:UDP-N-acetylmuramoyl-tripeptide--D-alanyl-D-alanine ligase
VLAVAAICSYAVRYYLHMMQLESYQTDGYARWLEKHRDKVTGFTLNAGVIATIASFVLDLLLGMLLGGKYGPIATLVVMLGGFGAAVYVYAQRLYEQQPKKPLVYTPRMKRLYAAAALICALGCLLLGTMRIPAYLLFATLPYIALIAARVMQPLEKRVNDVYLRDAQRILAERKDLIKIGVTGSFGKTSTKMILKTILEEKFRVFATSASYNTPMGLTRNIREQLLPEHEVFIAEMGARHVGDIKELCALVKPRYGVITSVGEQHLETFLNVKTVANTKFELIEQLPADGVAFFSADDGPVDELYQRAKCEKFRVGFGHGYLSMYAENIEVGVHGSRFLLCESNGERVPCAATLLGAHNIKNIILAASVARRLGLSMEQIARGIQKIEPVEHRLQLIEGAGDMIIIDDAFNANPVGAAEALRVLSAFAGRRIVVTPGMVEQGAREEEINRDFGRRMATKCDVAILVGQAHTKPIADGLISAGFARANMHVVQSLADATTLLAQIGRPKDVILFENDLPDNY